MLNVCTRMYVLSFMFMFVFGFFVFHTRFQNEPPGVVIDEDTD